MVGIETVRFIEISLELAKREWTAELVPRRIAEVDTNSIGRVFPAGFIPEAAAKTSRNEKGWSSSYLTSVPGRGVLLREKDGKRPPCVSVTGITYKLSGYVLADMRTGTAGFCNRPRSMAERLSC